MTLSITNNGAVVPAKGPTLAPRIWMLEAVPGRPPAVVTFTPGIRPAMTLLRLVAGISSSSLGLTEETELVIFRLDSVP